jgi:DNA topoisomerase-1
MPRRVTRLEQLRRDGIRRAGTPKSGFRYYHAEGRKVSKAELARIHALRLPPAWTEVAISPSPSAALQAGGKDAAGRWQYRYHERFVERQQQKKYLRLLQFARALPKMRATIDRDLRRPELDREKVLAAILRVLSTCFMRAGSQFYADEHGAYGIATLLKRHAKLKGDLVTFDYVGKGQKPQHRELRDRRVARVVRRLMRDAPGRALFQYVNGGGEWVDVRRRHINEYIKEVMGERFSAKDFRTWAGTLICACALARAGVEPAEPKTARKKKVVAAVKETAARLGNTPAICKSSYIYPSVLSGFDRGEVVSRFFGTVEELTEARVHGLHGTERALLELLDKSAKAAASPRPARTSARRRVRARVRRPAHRPVRKGGRKRSAVI